VFPEDLIIQNWYISNKQDTFQPDCHSVVVHAVFTSYLQVLARLTKGLHVDFPLGVPDAVDAGSTPSAEELAELPLHCALWSIIIGRQELNQGMMSREQVRLHVRFAMTTHTMEPWKPFAVHKPQMRTHFTHNLHQTGSVQID
jgi:hypothetical protein